MQFDQLKRREFITLARRRGRVAARGARAAVGDASDWVSQQRVGRVHLRHVQSAVAGSYVASTSTQPLC